MENKAVIIGIAGGSASGKTSIAQSIYDRFKGSHRVKIIKQDDYYKDQSDKTMEERVKTNYDHPFAFDNDLLVSDLKKLKKKELKNLLMIIQSIQEVILQKSLKIVMLLF